VPPREASGRQLPSCADPQDLTDPAARAAYVAALQANELKTERASRYQELRNIDDDAMLSLRLNLADFHAVTRSDSANLDGILRDAGLSDARRAKIDAMF
jgi:DnaJ-domain-containing protein 1